MKTAIKLKTAPDIMPPHAAKSTIVRGAHTIDERFIDPKYLPKEWSNPVNPVYRLPRPPNEMVEHATVNAAILRWRAGRRAEQNRERIPLVD